MLLTYLCASTNILSILISQQFGNKDKEKDDGKTTSLVGENNVNSIIASICKNSHLANNVMIRFIKLYISVHG